MGLLVVATFAIMLGVIITSLGLSLISERAAEQDYSTPSYNIYGGVSNSGVSYDDHPLRRLKSKYFHYRPKGSVVVSKKQWADIEKNIGIKITESKQDGKRLGYKQAVIEIQDKVKEEKAKAFPSSPYAVLDVESTDPLEKIEEKYNYLLKIYAPANFVSLDKTFTELAEIRCAQITRAWNQINLGIKPKSISGGNF